MRWIRLMSGVALVVAIMYLVSASMVSSRIKMGLPPKEAGLLAGILIGDKGGFDKVFYERLINSGLIHLVVVSGSNVMLLIGGLIELTAAFWGRKQSIVGGIIIGWWYANLVGWEVPVVRAMLMLSCWYWAQLWERKFDVERGLILTVGLMLIGEITLLKSVSFWLSLTAFLAVVWGRRMKLNPVFDAVWVSLWITPILSMIFGSISLVSPLTNILVVGLMEMITIMGVMGIILGGGMWLWPVYPALKYLTVIIEWGGSVPTWAIRFNWYVAGGWYFILFYFLLRKQLATR